MNVFHGRRNRYADCQFKSQRSQLRLMFLRYGDLLTEDRQFFLSVSHLTSLIAVTAFEFLEELHESRNESHSRS